MRELWLPLIWMPLGRPEASIVRSLSNAIWPLESRIVWPDSAGAKARQSPETAAAASSRSEPGPLSAALTTKLVAPAPRFELGVRPGEFAIGERASFPGWRTPSALRADHWLSTTP